MRDTRSTLRHFSLLTYSPSLYEESTPTPPPTNVAILDDCGDVLWFSVLIEINSVISNYRLYYIGRQKLMCAQSELASQGTDAVINDSPPSLRQCFCAASSSESSAGSETLALLYGTTLSTLRRCANPNIFQSTF